MFVVVLRAAGADGAERASDRRVSEAALRRGGEARHNPARRADFRYWPAAELLQRPARACPNTDGDGEATPFIVKTDRENVCDRVMSNVSSIVMN